MEEPKLIIEVKEGMIVNIIASEDIRIALIDYDWDVPSSQFLRPDRVAKYNKPLYSYLKKGRIRKRLKKFDF